MKKTNRLISLIMIVAVLLEWVNVVLFMAALGRNIDIALYNKLKDFEHIAIVFYLSATIDAILFGILFYRYKKQNDFKHMMLCMFCSLLQLILIIYKLNIWS